MKTESLNHKTTGAEAPSNPGSVLIVDDEEQNRTLLRDPLEARGYQITEAEDGERALQLVAEQPPDVILLDVMMPRMDGFEVCRRLKQDRKTAPVPILMVTALSERAERMVGIAAGANDFLNKPVDLQDLTLRVRNALYTKRLFDRLQAEQEKSERLLANMLPKPIAERMKRGELSIADLHPDVTVLVADLVGFTALSTQTGPEQVVCFLNEIFSAFDALVEQHCLEKIKTIGDAYMVAGGLTSLQPDHTGAGAALALGMMEEIGRFNSQYGASFRLRIGISTGPVVAGVIGRRKFAYDLWGDTVNLACRLESLGQPGSILVAPATYERLKHAYRFDGRHSVEGKGDSELVAYTLCSRL